MSAAPYSRLSYIAWKKEVTPGTALYPDVFGELVEESVKVPWTTGKIGTIANNRSKNLRNYKTAVDAPSGELTFLVEPKNIGYFFTGALAEAVDSTLSASESYQHDFEPGDTLKSFTIDIPVAGKNYLRRLFGAYIESLDFSIEDNKLQVTTGVKALGAFTNARVTLAASSGTALKVDQTSGLTISDTIIVIDKDNEDTELAEYTIAAIVDETTLTVSTIGVSLEVGDIVVIKRQTPTYSLSKELIFMGGADAYFYQGANAMQNLAAKSNLEDFSLKIMNELEVRHSARGADVIDRMPYKILTKGFAVEGSFKNFHPNPQMIDALRQNEQLGLRVNFLGQALDTNSAAAAAATIETDGTDTLSVTVDAAGEAGNDYAIKIVQGTSTLSAAISGKLITVTLDADTADNTTSLVAAVINALSGVACTSTGTDHVTVTDNPDKIEFAGGRDANEVELLRFDLPDIRLKPFDPNNGADNIVDEEISFTAFEDVNDEREIKVRLRNVVADY